MSYSLLIADRSYSSWSLRGWLCFAAFDVPVTVEDTRLYQPGFTEDLKRYAPARTVPAARMPEGGILTDSLAIAEELATRHPKAGFWPEDPTARALARSLVAEMHSGFSALREACPMNLRTAYSGVPVSDAVQADLNRIELLWGLARQHAADGPWLFGAYSLADVFYAPVAMRIAGYSLPVSEAGVAYINAHLAEPNFLAWRARGLEDSPQEAYRRAYVHIDFPERLMSSGA
ncbi:glutathione S-transferase [Tropicimonas sp. S265A]|uniref:glutathione S-transferase n=1 Tax=Tropicimonas sp. S265A TaxID=3415134 RepID=UPI003C7B9965